MGARAAAASLAFLAACGVAAPAALPLLAACGVATGAADRDEEPLLELERLVFVPAGRTATEAFGPPLVVGEARQPLLADRCELTWADWHRYGPVRPVDSGAEPPESTGPTERTLPPLVPGPSDWPACLTQVEAAEIAARRGMRLPTAREWIYIASGPAALRYPWGSREQQSLANTLELGRARPLAVGTFEGGRSPFGCYDMHGNVWEWVSDRVPGLDAAPEARAEPGGGALASVLGGSFLYHRRTTWTTRPEGYFALSLDPGTLSSDVGARCVVEARTYLRERAERWAAARDARARVRTVGRHFGPAAATLLEELCAAPGAAEPLSWLLEGARGVGAGSR